MLTSHLFRRFKPYSDPVLQRLSTRCCFLLVAVSSVLLRSQTLLSSARTINFAPTEPDQTATTMPVDVQVCVFIILSCLILPFVWLVKPFDWLLTCISLIRRKIWRQQSKESIQLDPQASGPEPPSEKKQLDAQVVSPRKQTTPPERFSLDSPRIMQGLRSEISASRSASPFSPLSLHPQPLIPSHFRRPASPVMPIAASKYCPPAVAARASSEDAALEGEAPHSAQSHSASSSTRVYREFEGARRAQA